MQSLNRQLIASFVVLTLAACKPSIAGVANAKTNATEQPLAITAAEAKNERIEKRIDVTGTLAPSQEAVVSLEVEGQIATINADLGDDVPRGATLAQITPAEFTWKVAQTDADLGAAEADYKRLVDLASKNLVSQQQLDEGRRRLDVAKAAADLAHKKYADTSLRAPFAGQIAKRLINAGEYVKAGTAAFSIVNNRPLKLRADVPERFAGLVTVGNVVQAYTEAQPETPIQGTITRVGPAIAQDSRSFPIEARFDNADGHLKAGSFARASILVQSQDDALTVPETAVMSFAGNPRVFVIDQDVVREQPIEIAGKSQTRVLIAKGLVAGQKVAVTSVELLSDGRTVAVR